MISLAIEHQAALVILPASGLDGAFLKLKTGLLLYSIVRILTLPPKARELPLKRRDLSQDIHFQLWRSFQNFNSRCSLRTWVYRVTHHVAVSHIIHERRTFLKLVSLEELDVRQDNALRPETIVREEDRLFQRATALLARLPFDDIDLLIVNRMGRTSADRAWTRM